METVDMRKSFFDFAERNGLALAPIPPGGKTPHDKDGCCIVGNVFDDCSTERAQWETWAKDNAGCGWIVVMGPSRTVAIDIDVGGVPAYMGWLRDNGLEHFEPHWLTPSGGAHVVFKVAADFDYALARQPDLAPHVNVRASFKSYLVCPPTVLAAGRYLRLPRVPIHDAPPALIAHITKVPTVAPAPSIAPGSYDAADVAQLVTWLNERDQFAEYQDWLSIGMCLKLAIGDAGLAVWQLAHNDTVDDRTEASKWQSFAGVQAPGAQTLNTWFQRAHKLGWKGSVRPSIDTMFAGAAVPDVASPSLAPAGAPGPTGGDMSTMPGWIAPAHNEDQLALMFADAHRHEVRHVYAWKSWMHWDGDQWSRDTTNIVFHLARTLCRIHADRHPMGSSANKSFASDRSVGAVMRMASSDRAIAVKDDIWDRDNFLLGTPGGVVDLKTGNLRPAKPEDYILKNAAVTPDSNRPTPTWDRLLGEVSCGDKELEKFLQRAAGYCTTGSNKEQVLFFLHGPERSGKGTFMHAITDILGDYHKPTRVETFAERKGFEPHLAELAVLKDARLITASETKEGQRWNETRLKEITGGDRIQANLMHQNPIDFLPTFKMMFAGNKRPHLTPDGAMRRRMLLIPFVFIVPTRQIDNDLGDKLKAEYPGILSWLIQGALDWQTEGLKPPKAVTDASEEYFAYESQTVLALWMNDNCMVDPTAETSSTKLYKNFCPYADMAGERAGSLMQFVRDLKNLKFTTRHTNKGNLIVGLKLTAALDSMFGKAGQPQPPIPGPRNAQEAKS